MYMLQAGVVVLLVGDSTGLEFREVASKGAAQPFIIVYVRCRTNFVRRTGRYHGDHELRT